MMIFEEADSILKSRKDATQRYEVSQVNEFNLSLDGQSLPVIFTTNFGDNIDPATRRRMKNVIRFKPLSQQQLGLACKKFFNNEVLAGCLTGIGDQIVIADFANLREQADLVGQTINRDNIREALTRTRNSRVMQNAIA